MLRSLAAPEIRLPPAAPLTPEEIREIGDLLYGDTYGDRWQSYLARDLSERLGRPVYPASVNQWLLRKRSVPLWLRPVIVDVAFAVQARLVERSSRIATRALILLQDVRDMAVELGDLPPPPDHEDDRHEDLGDVPAKPKPAPARKPRRVLEPSK